MAEAPLAAPNARLADASKAPEIGPRPGFEVLHEAATTLLDQVEARTLSQEAVQAAIATMGLGLAERSKEPRKPIATKATAEKFVEVDALRNRATRDLMESISDLPVPEG